MPVRQRCSKPRVYPHTGTSCLWNPTGNWSRKSTTYTTESAMVSSSIITGTFHFPVLDQKNKISKYNVGG